MAGRAKAAGAGTGYVVVVRPTCRPLSGQASAAVIPSGVPGLPAAGAWGGFARRAAGSIRGAAAPPRGGGQTCTRSRAARVRACASCAPARAGERPDLPVAHGVEDAGEQLAGRGGLGDVARLVAAAGDDVVLALARRVPAGWCWIASTSAQRSSGEPCLVMWPRVTLVSDSRCRGVSPAQEHSRAGPGTGVMSPISATITAASTGPMPGSGLERAVPVVTLQQVAEDRAPAG